MTEVIGATAIGLTITNLILVSLWLNGEVPKVVAYIFSWVNFASLGVYLFTEILIGLRKPPGDKLDQLKLIYSDNAAKIKNLRGEERKQFSPFQLYELAQYVLPYTEQVKSTVIEIRKYTSIAESKINHLVIPNSRHLRMEKKSSLLFVPKLNDGDKGKVIDKPNGGEKDQNGESTLCIICYSNQSNVVNSPCGHACVCRECLEDLMGRYVAKGDHLSSKKVEDKGQKCPMCRKNVNHAIAFEAVPSANTTTLNYREIETINFKEEEEMADLNDINLS